MSLAVAWNAVKLFGPLSTALLLFISSDRIPRASKEGYLHGEHHSTSAVVSLTALWSIISVSQRSISFLENTYVAPNRLRVVDSDAVRRELGCVCLNGHAMRKNVGCAQAKERRYLQARVEAFGTCRQCEFLARLSKGTVWTRSEARPLTTQSRMNSPLSDSVVLRLAILMLVKQRHE